MKQPPSNAKANVGKVQYTKYDGGIGGAKGEANGVEVSAEVLQFDNPQNMFGFSSGVEVKSVVAKGGLYFEGDKGFALGSTGAGDYFALKEANVHSNARVGDLNLYTNVGGDAGGVGAMSDFSLLDKQSDGTYHIITFDIGLEFIAGGNAKVDIYLKPRR